MEEYYSAMQIAGKGGNMDPSKQHANRENLGMREHVLYDSIHLSLKKKTIQSTTTAWGPAVA